MLPGRPFLNSPSEGIEPAVCAKSFAMIFDQLMRFFIRSALSLFRLRFGPLDETKRAVHDGDFVFMPFLGSKYERQFAVMDRRGDGQAYTGSQCDPYAGHLKGRFCIAQGNLVENAMVVTSMVNAFERTPGHLSARLMAALEAAQSYGGDRRGMMSAAMLIVKNGEKTNQGVIVRLAADMSLSPLTDLRRKLKGPWLADYQAHQPQSSGNMSKAIRRPKQ